MAASKQASKHTHAQCSHASVGLAQARPIYHCTRVLSTHAWIMSCKECVLILYSGKLSREKTITNFTVLWLFAKVFSAKFRGVTFFGVAKASNPQKFSPSMVSCYTVMHEGVLLLAVYNMALLGWYHSLHIHSCG